MCMSMLTMLSCLEAHLEWFRAADKSMTKARNDNIATLI